jgi:MFS family permease
MSLSPVTAATYRYDRLRAVASGVIDSASSTFLLLIAVQVFQADSLSKSLISAGGNIGLLLTLWLTPLAGRSKLPATRIASTLLVVGAVAFGVVSLWPTLPVYVLSVIIAMGCSTLMIPLITTAYQANYAPRERGHFVSRALVIRVAMAGMAGELGGQLLGFDLSLFRWMLLILGVSLAFAAWCVARIPAPAVTDPGREFSLISPFRAMRFIRTDRTLRFTLTAWMLMGFANLMMLPLRVEYLANPRYGISLGPQQIALYTVVIPSIVRIVLTPMWGMLFDRMNFFAMRIVLNIGFAIGVAAYFVGDSPAGLAFGAIVFGAAAAGGELAWSLWVTKFSPPEHVTEYMSIHTFFTGLRGIAAPLLVFQLVETVPIMWLGFACATLIVLASLILIPEMRKARE